MSTELYELLIFIVKCYCYVAISLLPSVLYHLYVSHESDLDDYAYPRKEWYRFLKIFYAKPAVAKYQKQFENLIKHESAEELEEPRRLTTFMRSDSQIIFGQDQKGNTLYLKLTLKEKRLAELNLQLRLSNGTIYQLPENPLTLICSIPERKWEAKGLKIDIIEPFQTLRITYNGSLRNCVRNCELKEIGDVQHIVFDFVWKAAADAKFFPQQSSTNALAKTVAMEPWKDSKWINLLGTQTGFDQYGMLLGQIKIAQSTSPLVLRLTSCRKRTWGPIEPKILRRCLTLFASDSCGLSFMLEVKSYKNGCKQLYTGSVIMPNKQIYTIDHCNISLPNYFEDKIIPGAFSFNFNAGAHIFKCSAFTYCQSIADVRNEEIEGFKSKIVKINYMINKEEATGLGVFCYERKGKGLKIPPFIMRPGKLVMEPENKYIASLTSVECKCVDLAGQKGANLAVLATVNKKYKHFEVLDGFCVFTTALNEHIQGNGNIKVILNELNDICCQISGEDLEETCKIIQTLFTQTPLSGHLQDMILNNLKALKHNDFEIKTENSYYWAVRASPVDASVRKQTIIYCRTEEEVLKGVITCWGGLYAYPNVLHRKQTGLPIISDLAIVIQLVITADTSGSLSTSDPVTGDPATMVITANYGLAKTTTDSMVQETALVNRTWNGYVTSVNQTSSTKYHKGRENVGDLKCLSIVQVYQLSEVAIVIEKALGGPRIIQFAYYKGILSILNVKPLAIMDEWSEFYLIHENDSAIMSEKDYTMGKSAENFFQEPCSVLTQAVSVNAFEESLQQIYYKNCNRENRFANILSVKENIVGLNMFETLLKKSDKDFSEEFQILQLILTGKLTVSEELYRFSNRFNGYRTVREKIKNVFQIFTYCWNSEDMSREAVILSKAIRLLTTTEMSAKELLKIIKRNTNLLNSIVLINCKIMQTNIFYQKLLLNLLYDENTELSENYYSGFLALFYEDVREKTLLNMELMALILKNMELADQFCELYPFEGMPWLEKYCRKVGQLLGIFMDKFGHRGPNEFELLSEPWGSDPLIFVKMLQNYLAKMDVEEKSKRNHKLTISQKFFKENMKGKFLNFLRNKVKQSFNEKNQTLDAIALTINKLRIAYKALGEKLVKEGKLPTTDLIFHLNVKEIDAIVTKRNTNLISKALKRSKLYANLNQYVPDNTDY